MNVFNLRLQMIRATEVKGEAFNLEGVGDPGFQASFQAEITSDVDDLKVDGTFDTKLRFTCRTSASSDPFFLLSVTGNFQVKDEATIKELKNKNGAYQVAALLFPYVRNLSVPILEHLGAADVAFPFFLPAPPENSEKSNPVIAKRRPKEKSKP